MPAEPELEADVLEAASTKRAPRKGSCTAAEELDAPESSLVAELLVCGATIIDGALHQSAARTFLGSGAPIICNQLD